MQTILRKSLIVSGLALAAAVIGQNANADPGDNVHWKSIVGIIQANSVVGTGTGAVTGAPGPWSALGGRVSLNLDRGKFDFDVRGRNSNYLFSFFFFRQFALQPTREWGK